MPNLLIEDGLANYTLSTSRIILKLDGTLILYPFDKHSNFVSSKTEFRFSTHEGLIGPSECKY